jgi:hypothetical protein
MYSRHVQSEVRGSFSLSGSRTRNNFFLIFIGHVDLNFNTTEELTASSRVKRWDTGKEFYEKVMRSFGKFNMSSQKMEMQLCAEEKWVQRISFKGLENTYCNHEIRHDL